MDTPSFSTPMGGGKTWEWADPNPHELGEHDLPLLSGSDGPRGPHGEDRRLMSVGYSAVQAARGQAISTASPQDSLQPVAIQASCSAMSGSQAASGQGTSQPDAKLNKQCNGSARLSQEPSQAASRQEVKQQESQLSQQFRRQASSIASIQETK